MTKQVIVVRKDLNMRKGKVGAQCAHASLSVFLGRGNATGKSVTIPLTEAMQAWMLSGSKKICVYVNSEEELIGVYQNAVKAGLPCSLITDRGDTEFKGVPTKTCCAIGPAFEAEIDPITKSLPLY